MISPQQECTNPFGAWGYKYNTYSCVCGFHTKEYVCPGIEYVFRTYTPTNSYLETSTDCIFGLPMTANLITKEEATNTDLCNLVCTGR